MRARVVSWSIAASVAWGIAPAAATDCPHQAAREATVETSGAKVVLVHAEAGALRIEGRPGAGVVRVHGTACAPDAEGLERIRLVAERRGTTVHIEAQLPEGPGSWRSSPHLDLTVEVPDSLPLDVRDGSGGAWIGGVAAVTVDDGSGELAIENVRGDVVVTDGSGEVTIRNAGSVLIRSDGSGTITVSGVRGNVVVRDDGSGSIEVSDVAGDFTVQDKGSGGIHHQGVKGQVKIPSRR